MQFLASRSSGLHSCHALITGSHRFLCCLNEASPRMIRILIADDSPPVRRGLRTLLGLNSEWQGLSGEAVDGVDAVRKGSPGFAPDIILMDFSTCRPRWTAYR